MLNVCVVFGGASSEHEVSLRSAVSVLENLNRERYKVRMVGITKDGRWLYFNGPLTMLLAGQWENSSYICPARLAKGPLGGELHLDQEENHLPASQRLRHRLLADPDQETDPAPVLPVDVVIPVLHGKNGEDGTIQGLLELLDIPYVGCGVLASAVCMDKAVSHTLLVSAGIPKTKLIALRQSDLSDMEALSARLEELGYPMFVKPANAGSSVGVTKVKSREELPTALGLAFAHDDKVVVEQAMTGQEIECAVMGNDEPVAAAVLGEIAPTNEFYDYSGKYLDDSTALYIPAHLDEDTARKVREVAVAAYKALGCQGLARVDFFVRPDRGVVLNEINTMPGFTSISMYPKLFEASGLSYPGLLDRLLDYALEK